MESFTLEIYHNFGNYVHGPTKINKFSHIFLPFTHVKGKHGCTGDATCQKLGTIKEPDVPYCEATPNDWMVQFDT